MPEWEDEPQAEAGEPAPEAEPHDESGLDLARSIARGLVGRTPKQQWRGRRGQQPSARGRSDETESSSPTGRALGGFSGARPDGRDPQTLDVSLGRFVDEHGWATELRVHGVFSRWAAIVGDEIAAHVRPESFAEARVVVRTDSTAWATQMKLLAPDVVRRLNEVLGDGTVELIEVLGPNAPSWGRGRLRVKGRGPRDTYG